MAKGGSARLGMTRLAWCCTQWLYSYCMPHYSIKRVMTATNNDDRAVPTFSSSAATLGGWRVRPMKPVGTCGRPERALNSSASPPGHHPRHDHHHGIATHSMNQIRCICHQINANMYCTHLGSAAPAGGAATATSATSGSGPTARAPPA
jgi:hypothetical protein